MNAAQKRSLKKRLKKLPRSRMVYPSTPLDRLKYHFWRVYTPYHPFVRELVTGLGFLHQHKGRHNYLLCRLDTHEIEQFVADLIARGFGRHPVAWREKGEIVSLRYVRDFAYQYHVRVFENGDVCGHYEYTPECYPLRHLRSAYVEDPSQDLREVLAEWTG